MVLDGDGKGLDAGKALWPQLSALMRRAKSGAPGDADEFLTQFQELVQVFPKSAWMSGKAESLLREILEALAPPRAAFAGHALKSWKASWNCEVATWADSLAI
eukprot:s351_g23.t1